MAISADELTVIKSVLRPMVDMQVECYREDGLTLEEAWEEFLKAKPEETDSETEEVMKDMFYSSWNGEK